MRKSKTPFRLVDRDSPLFGRDKEDEEPFTLEGQRIVWSSDSSWAIDDPSGDTEVGGRYDGRPKRIFLPRSKVRLIETGKKDLYDIEMPVWIAKEKGLV